MFDDDGGGGIDFWLELFSSCEVFAGPGNLPAGIIIKRERDVSVLDHHHHFDDATPCLAGLLLRVHLTTIFFLFSSSYFFFRRLLVSRFLPSLFRTLLPRHTYIYMCTKNLWPAACVY